MNKKILLSSLFVSILPQTLIVDKSSNLQVNNTKTDFPKFPSTFHCNSWGSTIYKDKKYYIFTGIDSENDVNLMIADTTNKLIGYHLSSAVITDKVMLYGFSFIDSNKLEIDSNYGQFIYESQENDFMVMSGLTRLNIDVHNSKVNVWNEKISQKLMIDASQKAYIYQDGSYREWPDSEKINYTSAISMDNATSVLVGASNKNDNTNPTLYRYDFETAETKSYNFQENIVGFLNDEKTTYILTTNKVYKLDNNEIKLVDEKIWESHRDIVFDNLYLNPFNHNLYICDKTKTNEKDDIFVLNPEKDSYRKINISQIGNESIKYIDFNPKNNDYVLTNDENENTWKLYAKISIEKMGLSVGIIIAIVLASVTAFAALAGAGYYFYKKKKKY